MVLSRIASAAIDEMLSISGNVEEQLLLPCPLAVLLAKHIQSIANDDNSRAHYSIFMRLILIVPQRFHCYRYQRCVVTTVIGYSYIFFN